MTRRFAVNCSILFTGLPLLDRPAAAKAAGFDAVEFWWPWDGRPVPEPSEIDAFCRAIDEAGVQLIGLNFYAGNMAAGERGVLSDPSRTTEFRESIPPLLEIAERTGVRLSNALYGQRRDDIPIHEQDETATENIAYAARRYAALGGTVLIEPLSRGLNGAYPLETAEDVRSVLDRVRAEPNVKFLFDTFHLATNGDDLRRVIRAHADDIGHVQLADAPGRGRPGTGRLDFAALLKALDEMSYSGWISLEYTEDALSGFSWIAEFDRDERHGIRR
ncbi:hydroxypyruvate isomerase family protein [Spirillospora albida]|uniref:hydroxypyruvate isomerase family protein n=1 Tax=Spirillospora albida TaxID=58123 RepID=UPI0006920C70|nr:TIM barrel protein [Spirillospora albida]